jgi:hypothetical protein
MADNRQMMNEAAAQFREGRDTAATKEKTATEIMAEVNSANALVGTMLLLSYTYQKQQYQEIVRRFFTANSRDPDVRAFRLRVLKQGVPDYLLDPDFWTVDPEQVLGSGNKMLQIAMADKLMAVRPLLDPDAQRDVVRMYVQANSDDPNLAVRWVPTQPILVTESMHDAELVAGSLMAGVKVRPRAGQDPTQMMMGLLKSVGEIADGILAASQTPTKREVAGLANIAQAINGYMNLSAQDPANKDLVADVRKQLAALVRQLVQWNQQLMEQSQEGNGGVDPKIAKELALTQAKVEGMQAQIQAKIQADNAKNAQRIGQREEQFQQKQRQLEEQHIATLRKKLQDTQVETTIADAKAATEIQNDRMATMAELDQGEPPNA